MKLRVLGCSGGIGQGLYTSSYLIDHDTLLDAGSGVGELTLKEMRQLTHIFITHSHMDHILSIPLLVDTLYSHLKKQPLTVYARTETIEALKAHIFNWQIWPDFSELPDKQSPVLKFIEMNPGDVVYVGEKQVEMIDVNHSVPAAAYMVTSNGKSLAYTGDTTTCDALWQRLNQLPELNLLLIEVAFPQEEIELAHLSKHYCPSLMAHDLKKLMHKPQIGVVHFKLGDEKCIFEQCCKAVNNQLKLCHLASGDIFQI